MALIQGTIGSDNLFGTTDNDQIHGLDGNDYLYAYGGKDQLFGGPGDDWLIPGAGKDLVDGGDGNDGVSYYESNDGVTVKLNSKGNADGKGGDAKGDEIKSVVSIEGSDFKDALTGSKHDNALYGLDGKDKLDGGKGDDWLDGGAGKDVIDGGKGSADIVSYQYGSVGVNVKLGKDGAKTKGKGGEAAGDKIENVEWIDGSNHDDILTGNDLGNNLYGLGGNDVLEGDKGKDELYGGAGNEQLFGGAGGDLFVFATAFGHDVIADFEPGSDVVWFYDGLFDGFSDMLTAASQVGADVVIAYDASNTLTLRNMTFNQLTSSDFQFVT